MPFQDESLLQAVTCVSSRLDPAFVIDLRGACWGGGGGAADCPRGVWTLLFQSLN